jgi:phenylacetate-CoA ligase
MKTYPLETIISVARSLSSYYRDLYKGIKESGWKIADLPPVEQQAFWEHNAVENNRLLTGEMDDGIIFKSGGTPGKPKFSVYTREEWESLTTTMGFHLADSGIEKGDRVANLFYAGELYSSFIFLHDSLQRCPIEVMIFPISGAAPLEFIAKELGDFQINTLCGVPTELINLTEHIKNEGIDGLKIEKVYFGGETMYEDQRKLMKEVFPGIRIFSIGYASVDAGLLGFIDENCGFNEHRVFDDYNIIEIVDEESGEVIEACNKEGKILTTNLSRLLMPIIRYPVGDRGIWIEEKGTKNRKFKILGRSEEGARIGVVTMYVDNFMYILHLVKPVFHASNFQMVIDHIRKLDRLTLRIAVDDPKAVKQEWEDKLLETIFTERPAILDEIAIKGIHPINIEWIGQDELKINPRTGKIRRIIDNRFN